MSRFPVDGVSIEHGGAFAYKANCPTCLLKLDLHQPDPSLPDRLLGICERCKTWSLIDVGQGGLLYVRPLPEAP